MASASPLREVVISGAGVEVIRYSNKRRREDIVALLNTTPRGKRLHCPVIIIPPAHGKRKESTTVLAQILVESFAKARRDVVMLRFDGIRNIGESSAAAAAQELRTRLR